MSKEQEKYYSHTHCWNNEQKNLGGVPPCGIKIENHKQCCLCDKPYEPNKEDCGCSNLYRTVCKEHSTPPEEKCELEHLNPIFYEGYAECSNCGEKIENSKFSTPSHSWEEEFDEKFVRDDGLMDKYYYDEKGDTEFSANVIKAFISKTLQEQRDSLRKMVEGKKKAETREVRKSGDWDLAIGYNTALEDIINGLTDLEKENI